MNDESIQGGRKTGKRSLSQEFDKVPGSRQWRRLLPNRSKSDGGPHKQQQSAASAGRAASNAKHPLFGPSPAAKLLPPDKSKASEAAAKRQYMEGEPSRRYTCMGGRPRPPLRGHITVKRAVKRASAPKPGDCGGSGDAPAGSIDKLETAGSRLSPWRTRPRRPRPRFGAFTPAAHGVSICRGMHAKASERFQLAQERGPKDGLGRIRRFAFWDTPRCRHPAAAASFLVPRSSFLHPRHTPIPATSPGLSSDAVGVFQSKGDGRRTILAARAGRAAAQPKR